MYQNTHIQCGADKKLARIIVTNDSTLNKNWSFYIGRISPYGGVVAENLVKNYRLISLKLLKWLNKIVNLMERLNR